MNKNKNKISIKLVENSFSTSEDGIIRFNSPLTITDTSEQWNGTKYDIKSMNISEYSGLLTADHSSRIESAIGKVFGLKKIANNRVAIDGLDLAVKENALALYAFNMVKAKYLTDFSIETIGPWPDDNGVYYNSSLVGLSLVTTGNNKSASINEVVLNSIEQAKELNLDTSIVEDNFVCYDNDSNRKNSKSNTKEFEIMYKTIKNSREFAVEVKYTNASGDECTATLQPGMSMDVAENQVEAVTKQINDAQAPKVEEDKTLNAIADLAKVVAKLEQNAFDNSVSKPEFKADAKADAKNDLALLGYKQRAGLQINSAWDALKGGSIEAKETLRKINELNFNELVKAGRVDNTMTIADMGNFVIPPEMLTEIEGFRSDFSPLLSRLNFKETLSMQMAWLKRSGDISMTEVETCDDGANGNLKPISEYGADYNISNLQELAAVTPVCNAATRFLAVDLLGDVAAGYRTDYDRKKAQLFIARLQQAVNSTGKKTPYNGTTDVKTLQSWIDLGTSATDEVMNGVYIFNNKTYGELKKRIVAGGIGGPLATLLTTGEQSMIDGKSFIVVPNELMPALNSAETKSFVVEGVTVTIDQAVFYLDLNTFTGRVSGGLQYDLSTEAAYEVSGTVKSAYQRNELVLRGSFFRGGAVKDEDKVASMYAAGVS